MQVVEPRREQAAEVVGRCLEQAAEEARNRLAQTEIQPPSSFRRRPESSGLHKPFPQSGNDIEAWHWVSLARAGRNGAPLIPRPAFLGGLFPTPLYHLHPCRRGFQPTLE